MAEIGYATLGIIPSFDGFERNLTHGTSGTMSKVGGTAGGTFGDAAGRTAGSRFGSVFKSAAKAGLVGVAALGVGAFKLAKDSISAASDLEESTNKVQQVFGKGAESVFRFSEKAADALGQTNQQARDAAATFGLFGNIAGLSDKKSAKFATRMTTLASDLASFHNTEPSEAVEALGAALRGESEPIRSYGVLLDEATLKAEALRMGLLEPVKDKAQIQGYQVAILEGQKAYNDAVDEFGPKSLEALKAEAALGTARDRLRKATEGTIPPLTQQQKVLAAQSAIFKQTEVAQGDFARTSDGLANQQRRLSARFEDAKAKLGTGLLPIMTDAADFLLDKGIPAFEDFSTWFNRKGIPAIKDFAKKAKPIADDLMPEIKDAFDAVWDVAKKAAPVVKNLFEGFNNLPAGLKSAVLIGAGATFAAKKITGKSASGLIGSAVGAVKVQKVFETNPAALGGGVGGGGGKPPGFVGKALPVVGTVGLTATAVAAIGTVAAAGVLKLHHEVAPKTDEIAGTPNFGEGLAKSGFLQNMDEGKEKVDALVDSTNRFKGALDLVGAKKVNPDLRIPNIMQEQDRLGSFASKLDLVGSTKIRPNVQITGVDHARAQVDDLLDSLDAVAAVDITGLSGLVAVGASAAARGRGGPRPRNAGRDRQRQRNLGGAP